MKRLPASLLALLLAALVAPAAVHARSSDRNQPMDIDAGTAEYSVDDSRPTILSGGVVITQGTLDIRSSRAEVTQRGGEPVRALLTGSPVKLTQLLDDGTRMNVSASKVDYDLKGEIATFIGGVNVQQPRGTLSGERLVYNMRTGQVSGGGQGSGRVKMRILPKNAAPATKEGR